MRKRFKIKNLIRNNRYAFLSRGEERNLLPNAVRLEISGGGWTSPLLHSWGSLKKYGARLMCGSNEPTPTRISKFAGSLRNSALPLGEGGHSPLLHSGCPLQPNMLRSVIPQQFRYDFREDVFWYPWIATVARSWNKFRMTFKKLGHVENPTWSNFCNELNVLADLRTDGVPKAQIRIANRLSRLSRKAFRRNSVSAEQIQDTS